jgi:HlyD family secretion protein
MNDPDSSGKLSLLNGQPINRSQVRNYFILYSLRSGLGVAQHHNLSKVRRVGRWFLPGHFLLSVFLLIGVSCNFQNNEEKIKPRITDITESVYASVTVRPADSYFPQPTRSGIIQEIFVEEGDIVEEGQVLFRIAPAAEVNNRLTTAELNLKEAKANYIGETNLLLNIESELASVKQQLALDSINFQRQKRLWAQKIGKEVDLDRAKLAYEATRNQFDILQKRYAQTLINLESNYKKALSQVKAERSQIGDFVVRSAIDGKVYSVQKEVGELISSQEQFAEIGSADHFVIEMDIDEVDITKIELGDTVIIALDAYPNEVFTAKTSRIAPKKDDVTQTFRVESLFVQTPPKLYNGLSGEASIIVANRKNALVIPSEYLIAGNKVLTPEGERKVKPGLKNMEFIEILSGIDTATFVIKPSQQ